MLCAIDIDGTIAGRNMRQFARVCNESLSLGITSDQLQKKMLYTTFLQLPEVTAYQLRVGQQRFDRDIRWIDLDPHVLLSMVPLPGAVQGVTQLAQHATVSYYTARYSSIQLHRNPAMASATQQWLTEKCFPQSDNIVFCTSIADKLSRLADRIKDEAEQIILIDDQYSRLLEELMSLDQCHVDLLQQHMQLVAFGAREVPERCHGFQVVPLPSWNDLPLYIDSLAVSDKQKEYHMSSEEFHRLLPEYQRFMTLIALGYKRLGMSNEAIDHVWHSHILYSKRYREFCTACIGFFIDHRPNLTGSPRLECDVPETPPAKCVPEPPETPPAKCGVACDYDDDPRDELSVIPFEQAYVQAFGTYPPAIWGLSHNIL